MNLQRERKVVRSAGKRAGAVLALSLMIAGLFASSASAINEFAFGDRTASSATFDGLRGNQGIRTNPATVNGVTYVHITQADVGSLEDSFVAVGTYNGQGTTGHSQDCAEDYDSGWSGYYDGVIAGVYFCQKFGDDNWGVGDAPAFRIERGNDCFVGGNAGWGLNFAGSQRACLNSGASGASRLIVGLEVVSSSGTDRNVDVKYTSLDRSATGSTTWGAFDNNGSGADPSYSFTRVSSTAVNAFLAPLD